MAHPWLAFALLGGALVAVDNVLCGVINAYVRVKLR